MNYTKTILALMAATTLFSCKKKEDNKNSDSVVGKWKIIAETSDIPLNLKGDGNLTTDVFSAEDACDKDDIYVFYATGNYEVNAGNLKCRSSDPQVHTEGIWSKEGNTLSITFDSEVINGTILQLDKNTLKITRQTEFFNKDYIATTTFQRQ
jgi:hypothetical protein